MSFTSYLGKGGNFQCWGVVVVGSSFVTAGLTDIVALAITLGMFPTIHIATIVSIHTGHALIVIRDAMMKRVASHKTCCARHRGRVACRCGVSIAGHDRRRFQGIGRIPLNMKCDAGSNSRILRQDGLQRVIITVYGSGRLPDQRSRRLHCGEGCSRRIVSQGQVVVAGSVFDRPYHPLQQKATKDP